MYSDAQPLIKAGVPDAVIEEVTQRTPGFSAWHRRTVGNAVAATPANIHGQTSRAHLGLLAAPAVEQFLSLTKWSPEQWTEFVSDVYEPAAAAPSVLHFVCRACKESKFSLDGDDK